MKNHTRKKYQRQFNKLMRQLNQLMTARYGGRFVFCQRDADFVSFSGGSGYLDVRIRAIDKKSEEYADFNIEYAPIFTTVQWTMAETATKFCNTHLLKYGEDNLDYTNVKLNPAILKKEWKFHSIWRYL